MTEQELRQKVVNTFETWLGAKQGDPTHKHIIDTYNSHLPLARGHKMLYTEPWCAATVSAVAIENGLTDIIPTECSCTKQIELFQALGRWVENDAYVPNTGDIIYYDWEDSGYGDCQGRADHTGMVVDVLNGKIKVIEGNYAESVKHRVINVNNRYIRGYATPDYASKCNNEPLTYKEYVVRKGDSFWKIASEQLGSGTKYKELAEYNGMSTNAIIHTGDILKIPYDNVPVEKTFKRVIRL